MSLEERQALVGNVRLSGTSWDTQKADLLRVGAPGVEYSGTQTNLIAAVQWMLDNLDHTIGIKLTCVQAGHHNDGDRGHAGGNAADFWFWDYTTNDWLNANTQRWFEAMNLLGKCPYMWQVGAVGDGSDSPDSFHYAAKGFEERNAYTPGVSVFNDSGDAHLHAGATPA